MTDSCLCPRCGQAMPERDQIAVEVEKIRAWCLDQGRWLSPDGRVHADTAAEILGATVGTLRNWRYLGNGPEFHRRGRRGSITYSLESLSAYLQAQKKKPHDL